MNMQPSRPLGLRNPEDQISWITLKARFMGTVKARPKENVRPDLSEILIGQSVPALLFGAHNEFMC